MLLGYQYHKEDLIAAQTSGQNAKLEMLRHENLATSAAYVSQGDYIHNDVLAPIRKTLGFIPAAWKLGHDLGQLIQKFLCSDIRANLPTNPFTKRIASLELCPSMHPVNQSVYYWLNTFFPENIISYLGDRSEMAHSIEGRLPFLDRELAEFCLNLPIDMRLRNNTEKYILREAMKNLIPNEIYKRTKHIFAAPPIKTNNKQNIFLEFGYDIISSCEFNHMAIFNQQTVLKMLDNFPKQKNRNFMLHEFCLNAILSTFFLYKNISTPN